MHLRDAFDNLLPQGGDIVELSLQGPAGSNVSAACVEDLGNGVYSMQFVPDCPGAWTLVPRQVRAVCNTFAIPHCSIQANTGPLHILLPYILHKRPARSASRCFL